MKKINVSAPFTRVTCSPKGDIGVPGRTIVYSIESEVLQTTSGPIVFAGGETTMFEQVGWQLTPRDIFRHTVTGGEANVIVQKTVDGERTVVENTSKVKIGQAYEGEITFSLPKDNRIFGLGQHEKGVYDYRGQAEFLVQNNMKIPMPVFLCVGPQVNFAVVFDAGCLMTFEEHDGTARFTFDAVDRIDYYIVAGSSIDELIKGIRKLTGTAVMLPRWAFGYIQSRERYKTQADVLETAEEFLARGIPVSCIVQDWSTWEKGKWGSKYVDKERFPDIKSMITKLHDNDIAFMISIWPNPAIGCIDNTELAEAGGLFSNGTTYNAFDENARRIYWKQCEREWFNAGTDAWWCDSTEPFTPDWNGSVKKSCSERYELSKEAATKHIDARCANDYALVHAQGIYENQRAASSSKRVVNLTRSGSLSIQRYGAILWSGDINAKWDTLRSQIAEGLNMCASGIPYWTVDIGAFFTGSDRCWRAWSGSGDKETPWFWDGDYEDGNKDMGYRELYVRWLQYGTFMPIMRSHGTDTPREPWHFGQPGEKYYDTIVKYIKLRYRLLPYIYSLAGMVTREGYTMMRNLNFDFPGDPMACAISDSYMFGPAFLVCPVTYPMEYEAGSKAIQEPLLREVYLPSGGWYDFETKEYISGGRTISANAPVSTIPVYVRTGSIVPVSVKGDGEIDALEIYAGASSSFTLYFDNGRDYSYENGDYAAVTVTWDDESGKLYVKSIDGSYPFPQSLKTVIYHTNGTRSEREFTFVGYVV